MCPDIHFVTRKRATWKVYLCGTYLSSTTDDAIASIAPNSYTLCEQRTWDALKTETSQITLHGYGPADVQNLEQTMPNYSKAIPQRTN